MIFRRKLRTEEKSGHREGQIALCARNCMVISWKRNKTDSAYPQI